MADIAKELLAFKEAEDGEDVRDGFVTSITSMNNQCIETERKCDAKITEMNTLKANLQTAENGRVAAEGKRETAESIRVNSENTRGTAEEKRVVEEGKRVTDETARKNQEQARQTQEATRVSGETKRTTEEGKRIAAETDRISKESLRVTNENTRKSQEGTRQTQEQGRVNAESDRVLKESGRASAEGTRQSQESTRQTQESGRVSKETSRVTEEGKRVTEEGKRAAAETARNTAEIGRATKETSRVTEEGKRVTAESDRASKETARASAEGTRQSQETARQTNTTAAIKSCDAAKDRANKAAADAEGVVAGTGLIPTSEKGKANGVASLDGSTKIPIIQIPNIPAGNVTQDATKRLVADTEKVAWNGKLDPAGNASNVTTVFTQAATRTNISTGEKLSVSFGKIMKWFADLGTAAFATIADNLTTSTKGSVLDANQGKILKDTKLEKSDVINNLTTTDTAKALSAAQGKALGDGKVDKTKIVASTSITQAGFLMDGKTCSDAITKVNSDLVNFEIGSISFVGTITAQTKTIVKNKHLAKAIFEFSINSTFAGNVQIGNLSYPCKYTDFGTAWAANGMIVSVYVSGVGIYMQSEQPIPANTAIRGGIDYFCL